MYTNKSALFAPLRITAAKLHLSDLFDAGECGSLHCHIEIEDAAEMKIYDLSLTVSVF